MSPTDSSSPDDGLDDFHSSSPDDGLDDFLQFQVEEQLKNNGNNTKKINWQEVSRNFSAIIDDLGDASLKESRLIKLKLNKYMRQPCIRLCHVSSSWMKIRIRITSIPNHVIVW